MIRGVVMLLGAMPLVAGALSQKDRHQLVEHLEKTRDAFGASVSGLSDAQLKYRPSSESWTIAECAEHITLSEDLMFKDFQDDFLSLTPAAGRKSETPDAKVLEYGTDRTKRRAKAEAAYQPKGRWVTIPETLDHFQKSRKRTLETAQTTQEDLRGRVNGKGTMDAYQFLLILSAHTQRHTLQIAEIKASPGFPK